MQDIFSMKQAVTRSISPENRTGEPGRGGIALRPFVRLPCNRRHTSMERA